MYFEVYNYRNVFIFILFMFLYVIISVILAVMEWYIAQFYVITVELWRSVGIETP